MEYCVDGDGNWKSLVSNTNSESINKGQTLSFRGNLTPTSSGSSKGVGTFKISKSCDLTGNCNSLLFGDDAADNLDLTGKDYAFYYLFSNCNTIKNISSNFLPATTLASHCYEWMFLDCRYLTTAPALPATTLAQSCYDGMFTNCTSLTTAPELPATTLAQSCYQSMFKNCTSLTAAPELPATTLASSCYSSMFYGSSKLNYIKAMFTTKPSTTYTNNWVKGVTSRGTFVKNKNATWSVTGTSGIPSGWTVQTA